MTLQYFDSLFQRDNLQKSQFFKGLPKVLPKLPKVRLTHVQYVEMVTIKPLGVTLEEQEGFSFRSL